MVKVIPEPYSVQLLDDAPFRLELETTVDVPEGLAHLADWFGNQLSRVTELGRDAASPGSDARIVVSIEDDSRFADLPRTGGLRADGGEANGECHAIDVDEHGIFIRARQPEGAFRGLTTVLQLAATGEIVGGAIQIPAMTIVDAPRFAWRGLSFDAVRRAATVNDIEQVIDLLAFYKASVLHLHLTDDEGWRIQIDAWPKLTEIGRGTASDGRGGGFFTKDDFRHIVRYASDRFITVVPGIDLPGHVGAALRAYPELSGGEMSIPGLSPGEANSILRPDNPVVIPFLRDVLGEIAEISPSAYIHIGANEVVGMYLEPCHQLLREVRAIARSNGKRIVGWQEMARAGCEPGDIAQIWMTPSVGGPGGFDVDDPVGVDLPPDIDEALAAGMELREIAAYDLIRALDQGASVLVSQQSKTYLDTKYAEASSNPAQADARRRLGMPYYAWSTVEDFYRWDPATLRAALKESRIAGVEAAIWSETIESLDDAFLMMLPRYPGVMEKAWSRPVESVPAWASYAPRLASHAAVWDRLGWPYFRSSVVWPDDV